MHNAEVTINAKYDPAGNCIYCAEAPAGVNAQDWHNHLSHNLQIHPLSGGRAAFYTTHEDLARIKTMEIQREAF